MVTREGIGETEGRECRGSSWIRGQAGQGVLVEAFPESRLEMGTVNRVPRGQEWEPQSGGKKRVKHQGAGGKPWEPVPRAARA